MSRPLGTEGRDEADAEDVLLAEWAAELADQVRTGEPIDLDDLIRRHPNRAEAIRRLLPAIALMADLGSSPECDETVSRPVFSADHPDADLESLGDFRLLRVVGRGGMGWVYEAEQISLRRRVALKVLPFAAALDPRQIQRFRVEARAAAFLHHTHIVPVYAVGAERGIHYYAMQFIEGQTLAEIIRALRLAEGMETVSENAIAPAVPAGSSDSSRGRAHSNRVARLGMQAAQALEYAHRQGILHRDIKPGNLMVNDHGHVFVTDFGLARFSDDPGLTMTGDVLGTLRYMSPEQALGKPAVTDQRSDVYSLGVTLYEFATLRAAFDGQDRVAILRRIARDEPAPLRRNNPAVPIDLQTIIHKAMDKDPAARYATAGALADDLGRFLDGLPILARRPSLTDRATKWVRRHWQLTATALALVGVIAILAVAGLSWSNARLSGYVERLEREVRRADDSAAEAGRLRRFAEESQRFASRHLSAARLRDARHALDSREYERAQEILDEVRSDAGHSDPPGFVWRYLWRLSRREVEVYFGHEVAVLRLVTAPDGTRFASGDGSGVIRLWDLATGQCLTTLRGHEQPIRSLAFARDGRHFASVGHDDRKPGRVVSELRVWDLVTGRILPTPAEFERRSIEWIMFLAEDSRLGVVSRPVDDPAARAEFRVLEIAGDQVREATRRRVECAGHGSQASEKRIVVLQRPDSTLAAFDGLTGATLWSDRSPVKLGRTLRMSSDARWVAYQDGTNLVTRHAATGQPRAQYSLARDESVANLLFSGDGATLAETDRSGRVLLHDLSRAGPGTEPRLLRPAHLDRQDWTGMTFSADGRSLALTAFDLRGKRPPLSLWDVASGRLLAGYPGRSTPTTYPNFTADDRSLLFLSGGSLCRWRLDPPDPSGHLVLAGHKDEAWTVAFSPDGRFLATGGDDTDEPQTIKLWEADTGRFVAGWKGHAATVTSLAFSPDSRVLASASLESEGSIKLWDVKTRRQILRLEPLACRSRSVAFSLDGGVLASAGDDHTVRLWDAATGRLLRELNGHTDGVHQVAFSPDGRVLASVADDATLRLWDRTSGREQRVLAAQNRLTAVAFAPDGRSIAAADEHGIIILWDTADGRVLRRLVREDDSLRALAFSPDGRTLAAAGEGTMIRLWDPDTGQELVELEGLRAPINGLAFSPDGFALASCSHDGAVWVWQSRDR